MQFILILWNSAGLQKLRLLFFPFSMVTPSFDSNSLSLLVPWLFLFPSFFSPLFPFFFSQKSLPPLLKSRISRMRFLIFSFLSIIPYPLSHNITLLLKMATYYHFAPMFSKIFVKYTIIYVTYLTVTRYNIKDTFVN